MFEITLFWPLSAALVSTIYFFLIKYYAITHNNIILVFVILLELLVIYLYYKSLTLSPSGIMYAIINGLSVIIGALIAVIFFREKLTPIDIIGIILIIIGIVIVGQKKSSVEF
jgi:multidrug transporter EmrE-like cation transporter